MPQPPSSREKPKSPPEPAVAVGAWKDSAKPRRCSFPGPRDARAALRVAMDRAAFAEVTAHAKASLDAEVCGVLAGHVCEDDEGVFVHVEAALRGSAASSGKTHVTFTQETWTHVHEQLERERPKRQMVGWYHTHPGFGVEFSEMDLFIQRNFFPAPTQIALVTDPLGGALAICTMTADGVGYLDRFWVEGREQQCQVPQLPETTRRDAAPPVGAAPEAIEVRLSQLTQALDDLRGSYHRFLLFCGMTVGTGMLLLIGWTIWRGFVTENKPPELISYMPVPVQVGDKSLMLGVAIAKWEVPPEIDPLRENAELRKKLAELTAKKGGANPAAAPATPAPAPVQITVPTQPVEPAPASPNP